MKKGLVTGLVAATACLLGCKLFMGAMAMHTVWCALFTGGVVYGYCHLFCKGGSCESKK